MNPASPFFTCPARPVQEKANGVMQGNVSLGSELLLEQRVNGMWIGGSGHHLLIQLVVTSPCRPGGAPAQNPEMSAIPCPWVSTLL